MPEELRSAAGVGSIVDVDGAIDVEVAGFTASSDVEARDAGWSVFKTSERLEESEFKLAF